MYPKGHGDHYTAIIRTQILYMELLPPINKVFLLVLQQEPMTFLPWSPFSCCT